MALATVTNRITDGSGHPLLGVPVYARLYPPTGAFVSASGDEIVDSVDTVTDANGDWSMPLEKNPDMTPANSYWLVAEQIPQANGGPRLWQAIVTANTTLMAAVAAFLLPGPVLPTGLTVAAGDARYLLDVPAGVPVRYASDAIGDDANDGRSWAKATKTIAAAIAALPLVGGQPAGTVVLDEGTFDVGASTVNLNEKTTLEGPGSLLCQIIGTGGSGDVVRWRASPFTVAQAGAIRGVTIDGTASAAGAVGLHMGDIVGPELDDVVIQNFTGAGSTGLWCDNVTDWTERVTALRLKLENNSTSWRFTVNGGNDSFGYNRWLDVRMVVNSGQVGISVEGTSLVYSNTFVGTVNVGGPSGNTAIVVDVKDTAHLYQTSFAPFAMEQTTGDSATSVRVAAGATFGYHGLLITGGMPFAGTASRFYYHDGDAAGVVAIGVPGNAALTIDGTLGRIFQIGPMAGNITGTTFTNLLQGVIYTLIFIQDGAGSRSISLPGTFKWAGGAFPTWSTAGDKRDIVQFYFDGANQYEVSRSMGVS